MLRRKSCGVELMDLGATADRYFLVYALGMGNQPCCTTACRRFLAYAHNRRERRVEALVAIRLALGRCRADQHRAVGISACFLIVGLVPPRQDRQTFARRSHSLV